MFKLFSRVGQFALVAVLLFVFAGAASAATFKESERQSGSKRSSDFNHIGALEKQGFFNGFDGRYVQLIEEGTYRKVRYLVKDDVTILLNDQPIERVRILIHSIVKLTIVEGVVVEIVLVEESS